MKKIGLSLVSGLLVLGLSGCGACCDGSDHNISIVDDNKSVIYTNSFVSIESYCRCSGEVFDAGEIEMKYFSNGTFEYEVNLNVQGAYYDEYMKEYTKTYRELGGSGDFLSIEELVDGFIG